MLMRNPCMSLHMIKHNYTEPHITEIIKKAVIYARKDNYVADRKQKTNEINKQ